MTGLFFRAFSTPSSGGEFTMKKEKSAEKERKMERTWKK